ncbi:hypothetical protein BJ138DRAFT_1181312 [Hygrophoropsis aurantiaca]|uniref:Uncharacterized protein n=1 Tax=Hygrophoropsis aurantiaca TaxID=72124 RepID=A0ACB8A7J6_9AGAM|nr:hypothetical protein BJ138DRAFT_1181312 [Hygrophoropsis aurantiaca]
MACLREHPTNRHGTVPLAATRRLFWYITRALLVYVPSWTGLLIIIWADIQGEDIQCRTSDTRTFNTGDTRTPNKSGHGAEVTLLPLRKGTSWLQPAVSLHFSCQPKWLTRCHSAPRGSEDSVQQRHISVRAPEIQVELFGAMNPWTHSPSSVPLIRVRGQDTIEAWMHSLNRLGFTTSGCALDRMSWGYKYKNQSRSGEDLEGVSWATPGPASVPLAAGASWAGSEADSVASSPSWASSAKSRVPA